MIASSPMVQKESRPSPDQILNVAAKRNYELPRLVTHVIDGSDVSSRLSMSGNI